MINLDSKYVRQLSERWQREGLAYAKAVNAFVERGMAKGWDKVGKEPVDTRADMAYKVLRVVRAANQQGQVARLRELFAPFREPFLKRLQENGQRLGSIVLLPDQRIIVRIGLAWEKGPVYLVDGTKIVCQRGIIAVGRSPDRRFIAVARKDMIEIRQGWKGRIVTTLNWPTGLEGQWRTLPIKALKGPPDLEEIIAFPDGKRVLLVSGDGIFVVGPDGGLRIHPDVEDHRKKIEEAHGQYDPPLIGDMAHGAISPDGALICAGHQASKHVIFNDDLERIATIEPRLDYPNHAAFSADGRHLALSSIGLFSGSTVGVATNRLSKSKLKVIKLDNGCEVNAVAAHENQYILGEARGYLYAVNTRGKRLWQYFLGSTISGMDISPDGRTLAVGSYSGILHLLDLHTGSRDPFAIGTAAHRERRRWLFWATEAKPLAW